MVLHEPAEESAAAANVMGRSQQPDRKHRLKHRFEVSKKLGQGTYGKVQLAINKETAQEVAIKTIKKSKIESEQDLVRIRREIQIMSSIQHPHIIHIYEVFENKEKIVLVMQYASGGELYDYLSEKKALHDVDARRIFRQIAAAVYYCHKNKICHRDLKLENVLLDERGNAKIADFGLSNVFDERHLLGTFCGSPLYASPEIVKGTPYYGPEVDCWSMGVLLYTLVYGAMPFDGSNFKRLVKQISDGDYYEPKKKSEASSLIRRLLTVSTSKRATIIDICTDWWVNLGYEHSLLQVSEDMANLTPVRIDLLLALAPSSPTPPADSDPMRQQTRLKDGQVVRQGDDGADVSSNSFAFISGGMAGEVKQIKAENPDDIFHENDDGSEEEFLSADAAAALEGLGDYEDSGGAKRRADMSFDGSMVRVSSIAHKTKKPRKSDSVQKQRKSQATLETPMEETNITATQVEPDVPLSEEPAVDLTRKIEETSVPEGHDSVPTEVPLKDSLQITPQDELSAGPETSQSLCPAEVQVPQPLIESQSPSEVVENPTAEDEEKKLPHTITETSSPTKEKKVKRKIISSKKAAAEKASKEKTTDEKIEKDELPQGSPKRDLKQSPEKSSVKSRSPAKSIRERSPSKGKESPRRPSLEPKEQPRRPSVDRADAPRKPSADSKVSSRRSSIDSKEGSRQPSELRESPRKSSVEPKDSPRKGSLDPTRSPRKIDQSKVADKPKPAEKLATAGARKPGKLVIPKFLDSPQGTPSPKTGEVKKLVLPIRSVSDAKKAFEFKNKPTLSPSKSTNAKKTAESPVIDVNASVVEDSTKMDSKNEDSHPLPVEVLSEPVNQYAIPSNVASVPTSSSSKVETENNNLAGSTDRDLVERGTPLVPTMTNSEPVSPEDDEKKKAGAKGILLKSIAKARLTERKLSQQSSLDSDTGSVASPVIGSPVIGTPITVKTSSVPFLKTPKPYCKEEVDTTVKSHAEIVLTEKVEAAPNATPTDSPISPPITAGESIWGMPLASSADKKLKKSVLSSSESDMNDNWRQEVEESLKRLSPEGASEEPINCQLNAETNEAGPQPITRSYKKFTFNKDGTCTTETGEIYTKPENNGTWTKVEKSTKVTTNHGGSKVIPEPLRVHREMSPLRHSDSQSSSGSNDIFDDIFDTWTGDSMFGNLMKMNSTFGRLPKDPFRRRDRRRDSMRRPKSEKKSHQDWARSEKRPGNLTDRDSSDNEDDFDFHCDGTDPLTLGSPNMLHFMRSMNKDFKNHLRAFKERHMPAYSRSLSRDRGDPTTRSRDPIPRNGQSTMTRSVSRDRAQSPPETVVRFVIESPRRQTSVRSEPRSYSREDLWSGIQKPQPGGFESEILGKGFRDLGGLSDFSTRYSNILNSPDPFFDRTSLYGTIRPKPHQRYQKSASREMPSSPSTPQSNRSGPEFTEKTHYDFSPENRRQRVETWLQASPGEPEEEFDPYFRVRTHLHDLPENRIYNPVGTKTYTKYNRSNTDLNSHPPFAKDQRSESLTNLERKREPTVVHFVPTPDGFCPEGQRDQGEDRKGSGSPECSVENKPPRQSNQTRVTSPAGYTRSMSNTPFRVITPPESVIEMETPSATGSPMVRMRVSFNPHPVVGSASTKGIPPGSPGISEGIWSQDEFSRRRSNDGDDSLSLLEALKTRGYRNVISQRFQHEQPPREMRPEEAVPCAPEAAGQTRCQQEAPQRGKACSYASAESENNACCMDTNPADCATKEKTNGDPPPPETAKKKNGEEASDGTLTPDSLDSSKEKIGEFKPKNYEEESVSERIRRKSYFLRFNDDRPKRRSFYRDSDFLTDYRSGLWSRFSIDDELDAAPVVPRRTNRKRNDTLEKRSSANLDDYIDEYETRRSDSRSSYNHDDFLSDDGLWGTYGGAKSRYVNGHTANNDTSWYERPGSLWSQRARHKSNAELSVVDTVPDLGERRWSSKNSLSSYSPSVTPKSPVLPHQDLLTSDSSHRVQRRSSLNEGGDCTLSEESDSKSRASEDCQETVNSDPNEIISRAMDILSQFGQD